MRPLFTASCNSGSPFSFNYRLGLRAFVGGGCRFFFNRRLCQRVMQVEVFGGDQRVRDRLLGQVTPLEVVRNHQDQSVFSAASELRIARLDARALASGRPVSPVEDHPLEQHNGID
jgi:hypothetical protein